MNIIGIYGVLLFLGFSLFFVHSTDWVDDLTKNIAKNGEFHQVKLMSRMADDEIFENSLIEELVDKLTQNLPTLRINFGEDFKLPVNSVPDETAGVRTPIDTGATLFLLVIESHDSLPIQMTKNCIDAIAEMATYHYCPKYLILSFVRKSSGHVEELLEYAWTKNMLDLTVIEVAEQKVPRNSITIERPAALPIIHQLNPFKKEYTRENRTANMKNLFPNKVINMWGYPMRTLAKGDDGFPLERRERSFLAHLLIKKLNGSEEYIKGELIVDSSKYWSILYTELQENNIDLIPVLYPYFPELGWSDTQRTVTLTVEEICAVVPIWPQSKTIVPAHLLLPFFLSFSVVLIVWIFMRLLGFKSYFWRMFNIGRVLFGVSVAQQPRGNVERIIFTSLLTIFVIYSSTVYASITDITLQQDGEVEFETIEELNNSGLIPHIAKSDSQRRSGIFSDELKGLGKVIVPESDITVCPLLMYTVKDMVCFMRKRDALYGIIGAGLQYTGSIYAKLAKPCLYTEIYSFIISKRSPYRSSLDNIIGRLNSAGIIARYYNRYDDTVKETSYRLKRQRKNTQTLSEPLLVITIVGFSVSIIVFLAEIIFYDVSMDKASKMRPPRPLFPYIE